MSHQFKRRCVFWRDEVVDLTACISKFVESNLPGPVLKEFHKGNDQINYGYTDKGLNLSNSKDAINFKELGTQLAYIYRFFASHTLIMGELLLSSSGWFGIRYQFNKSPDVTNLPQVNMFLDSLTAHHVTVTCFGGGPVSEVAAIAAWLRNEGIAQPLLFNIIDKYAEWKDVAHEVAKFCDVRMHYKELDFLSENLTDLLPYVESMDIVCMSKFLSALTAHRATATKTLKFVLQNMRRGAALIYIDNSGGGTTQWITGEAIKAGFFEVFSVGHYPARVNPAVLAPNERRSFYKVKVTRDLNIGFKIFIKGGLSGHWGNWDYPRTKSYYRVGDSCTSC